jgi:hypothetical protein
MSPTDFYVGLTISVVVLIALASVVLDVIVDELERARRRMRR